MAPFTGSINGTFINTNTGETICNTYPKYGNGTTPGNEAGTVSLTHSRDPRHPADDTSQLILVTSRSARLHDQAM